MRYKLRIIFFYFFAAIFLYACSSTIEDESESLTDENDIEYLKLIELYPSQVSYIFYDLQKKEVIASQDADVEMIPASIQKIVTNFAALEILGANITFPTILMHNGKIENGRLNGDLILQAGGDPHLNVSHLYNFAFAVQALGIREVDGDIIYDDSYFPTFSQINDDQPNYAKYNQTVSPFIFDNNNFRIFQNGNSKELVTIPNENLQEKDKQRLFDAYKNNTDQKKYMLDFMVAKEAILPLRDPAFYTASALKTILGNLGVSSKQIKSYKAVSAKKFNNLTIISQKESAYLEEHVSSSLLYSNNLITEILLLHTVKALGCEIDNLSDAANCLRAWYQENYQTQNWQGLNWENGSGLSDKTRITANHINEILKVAYNKKYENRYFPTFLPVSGVAGTLRNKFSDKSLKILAKTGTMNYVSSLAGYLFAGERQYSFVIIVNNQILRDIMLTSKERKLRKKAAEFTKRWYLDALKTQSQILDEHVSPSG